VLAGIPFRMPDGAELADRVAAVLHVVYLVFNEGYASSGADGVVRTDLCVEAVRLSALLERAASTPAGQWRLTRRCPRRVCRCRRFFTGQWISRARRRGRISPGSPSNTVRGFTRRTGRRWAAGRCASRTARCSRACCRAGQSNKGRFRACIWCGRSRSDGRCSRRRGLRD